MTKTTKRTKGDIGEEIATKYLVNKGYSIIDRNYWKPWGEIDIIVGKGEVLGFVEVKTISREKNALEAPKVRPEENFHAAKLRRLNRAIQTYLLDHKVSEQRSWQIILACVYLDFSTRRAKVELFENIVL